MTKKLRTTLAMILALMMLVLVSVPSCAEDYETIHDEDWGNVTEETLEENAPEMTPEFVRQGRAEQQAESKPEPKEEPKDEPKPEPVKEEPVQQEEPAAEEPMEEAPTQAEESADVEAAAETEAPEETVNTDSEAEEPVTEEAGEETPAEEEPAEEPAEESGEEQGEEAAAPEKEETEKGPEITITITTVMSGENEMKLIALVNDPENRKYTYQWQVSEDGGKTYTDIENETEDVLRVELDETNINDFWRVRVKAK